MIVERVAAPTLRTLILLNHLMDNKCSMLGSPSSNGKKCDYFQINNRICGFMIDLKLNVDEKTNICVRIVVHMVY